LCENSAGCRPKPKNQTTAADPANVEPDKSAAIDVLTTPSHEAVDAKVTQTDVPLDLKTESKWEDLLSGNELTRWNAFPPDDSDQWKLRDGILVCDSGKNGWLVSQDTYADFELTLEFRLVAKANSGLHFHYSGRGQLSNSSKEIQIIEESTYPTALKPTQRTGAVWKSVAPTGTALKAAGEWNKMHVHVEGNLVQVTLNEEPIVDVRISELQNSPVGHLAISNWRGEAKGCAFRNMRVRRLGQEPAGTESSGLTQPVPNLITSGSRELFDGSDLSHWQPMMCFGQDHNTHRPSTAAGDWIIEDGMMVCNTDRSGWLRSVDQFRDFVLRLEYRLPSRGNSDVYIRCPGTGRLSQTGMAIQLIEESTWGQPLTAFQKTGAVWGIVGPSASPQKSVGEWNQLVVVCEGIRIQVAINDQTVVDAVISDQRRTQAGFIGLANRRGEAKGTAFRNTLSNKRSS
jgi:hypothetical protein